MDEVSNAAKAGKLQIITSAWSINEAIEVIDRLGRRPKDPLTKGERQEIMATFTERFGATNEHSAFRIALIDHPIVSRSRLLIDELHISADDALHIYMGWVYDCSHFLIHDNKITQRLKATPLEGMKIIDLGNDNDRKIARAELGI